MTRYETSPSAPLSGLARPWPMMAVAVLLAVGTYGLLNLLGDGLPALLRLAVPLLALTLAGLAVQGQLRQTAWDFPARFCSAVLVALACLVCLVGYGCMASDWESGQLFFLVLSLVSLVGCLLLLLPSVPRRIVLSLIILFHFTGMVVAVTVIDPAPHTAPWVSKQLWTWVYRPYLSFLYMTNAYHFYSPNPGAPDFLWFTCHYEDGKYVWVKFPDPMRSPHHMHYQRHLALPAHTLGGPTRTPLTSAELAALKLPRPLRGSWEEICYRRELGSATLTYLPDGLPIPMVSDVELSVQYREPSDLNKQLLASVARRIYWTAPPHPEGKRLRSVKAYRVTQLILSPKELSEGMSSMEKTKHLPYFLGEFDADGKLLDPLDPFLYWYLPISWVPIGYPASVPQSRPGVPSIRIDAYPSPDKFLLDCLELHAAGRSNRLNNSNEEKK